MATLKGNPLLKFLVVPVVLLACLVAIGVLRDRSAPAPDAAHPSLTPDQAKALGIEGDTPSDTLRTMVAESRQLKEQLQNALKDNQSLKEDNEVFKQRLGSIDQKVDQRMQSSLEQVREQQQNFFGELQQRWERLENRPAATGSELPIGLGVQPGDGQQFQPPGADVIWIEPQDATALDANGRPLASGAGQAASGFSFPTAFGESVERGQKALSAGAGQVAEHVETEEQARRQVRKFYTLPQNSTLMGSVAMSALIGRVPIDGTVNDPYPFKVLIGPDNLTANGIDLPDVAGAVATGTASGDWTLSCVRGQIRSLTFVFHDGRVRTLPAPQENGASQQNNNQSAVNGQPAPVQGNGLGWISDPYGIPCISGVRRSNAAEYIGNQALVTAAGAAAASLVKNSNSSSYISNASGTLGSTGLSGNQAMGQILTQGVSDISDWMNKLYGQAFAAVYVQPGAQVAVHLDRELTIDYELKGRAVDHRTGASHVSANLD